jgi:hypothetical protein
MVKILLIVRNEIGVFVFDSIESQVLSKVKQEAAVVTTELSHLIFVTGPGMACETSNYLKLIIKTIVTLNINTRCVIRNLQQNQVRKP